MTTQRVSSVKKSNTVLGDFFFHMVLSLKEERDRWRLTPRTSITQLPECRSASWRSIDAISGWQRNVARRCEARARWNSMCVIDGLPGAKEREWPRKRGAAERVSIVQTNLRVEYWCVQRDTDEGPRVGFVRHGYDNQTMRNRSVPKYHNELEMNIEDGIVEMNVWHLRL